MRFLALIVVAASLLLAGIAVPAQDQNPPAAPTSPPDQSAPSPQPQTETAPAAPKTDPPPAPENQTQTPPPAALPTGVPKLARRKPATRTSGRKVVVRNGGVKDESAQLAPGMSKEQALHSRETTAQLLATTDANLKYVAGRQFTSQQQSLLDQIHTYIRQSKEASDSGDLTRAHTLAYKAHLLSDELRK
jgi:hypothetical protein